MYNILTESFIRTGAAVLTLPGLLATLSEGEHVDLLGIRHHQVYAVHGFLVNLAGLVTKRAKVKTFAHSEAWWREQLEGMTKDHPTAWDLLIEDASKPAFLQPATCGEPLQRWLTGPEINKRTKVATTKVDGWRLQYTPDMTDIYNTAASHAPKSRSMTHPLPEHWFYTLIALQTSVGTTSSKTFGSSRAGPTGRFYAGIRAGELSLGQWFVRDLGLLTSFGFSQKDGHDLLWLLPWEGRKGDALPFTTLNPMYIDVARLIRLIPSPFGGDSWMARTAPTQGGRVEALSGVSEDLWMPVQQSKKGEYHGIRIFDIGTIRYSTVHKVLWGEGCQSPLAMTITEEDGATPVFYMAGLIFESDQQANSLGFAERYLPVPAHCRHYLKEKEARQDAALKSREMIKTVKAVEKFFEGALHILFNTKKDRDKETSASKLVDAFDRKVDSIFFDSLFEALRTELKLKLWGETLCGFARKMLDEAAETLTQSQRLRRHALASNAFEAAEAAIWAKDDTKEALVEIDEEPEDNDQADLTEIQMEDQTIRTAAKKAALAVRYLGTGELSSLRRLNPNLPTNASYYAILDRIEKSFSEETETGLFSKDTLVREGTERQWAFLISLMACAPQANSDQTKIGTELARAQYTELRLERLLRASRRHLNSEFRDAVTRISGNHGHIDWGAFAILLLGSEDEANRVRRTIAKDYFKSLGR